MLSYNSAFYELRESLRPIYDEQEAAAIAHEVLGYITDASKFERLINKDTLLSAMQLSLYKKMKAELITAKPLQYVLGHSWFMGRKFEVNEHVLIPRPETEELVQWMINDHPGENISLDVLDIGTGSGCIPISLKLAIPEWNIASCDISNDALWVAETNARTLNADIQLKHQDFLNREQWPTFDMYDVIVSNPPYIPETEKDQLHANVKEYEPASALFVPGDNALLFYEAIAAFGKTHLKQNGTIYCELHVDYALKTETLFIENGYANTKLRKDMHGNLRMLKASL
jgi:release factor glutamine methyltransferase